MRRVFIASIGGAMLAAALGCRPADRATPPPDTSKPPAAEQKDKAAPAEAPATGQPAESTPSNSGTTNP